MTRRSSRTTTPDAERLVARAAEFIGFEPTSGMIKAKAAFWTLFRDDPSFDPARVSSAEIARRIDFPSVEKWMADPTFKAWFLNEAEFKQSVEFAAQLWMNRTLARLRAGDIADKDLVQLGKLLMEMAGRAGKAVGGPRGPATIDASPEDLRAQFHQAALSLGYAPPAETKK